MVDIFSNNINALATKNPVLAQKLQDYTLSEKPLLLKNDKFYNLMYKNHIVHNPKNPVLEAYEIFARVNNLPVAIHIIYGLGLGYLFQVASRKSNGTVILYEPDLNILKHSFTLVDFSNDILKKNVFIYDTYEDLSLEIYKHSDTQNFPQLITLNAQREIEAENFKKLSKDLQNLVGMFYLNLKYTQEKFYPSLKMLINNVFDLTKEEPLALYKDVYKGKTALIVSAGPTLDRNIDIIKKYRKNVVVFTVGTALKTLINNGITPDFLSSIETYDNSKQMENADLKDVNFITEPYSHPNLRKFNYKKIYTHAASNSPINNVWSEIFEQSTEEYFSKGTVSYTILNCARLLGFSKIILVGQDLAYIEGQCYSKDSAYKDLVCVHNQGKNIWEIQAKDFGSFADSLSNSPDVEERRKTAERRLRNLNSSLHYVKGIQGDSIPTESVYAAFIYPLSEYTKMFNDRIYINTSLVGAQIDGFKNIDLESALKDSSPVKKLELTSKYKVDTDKILQNLERKADELNIAYSKIQEGEKLAETLKKNLIQHKTVTQDVLKDLKQLSLNYVSLAIDFTKISKIFDLISASGKIDLDYEMKMMTNFEYPKVLNMCEKFEKYYTSVKSQTEELLNCIINTINQIESQELSYNK